MFSDRKSTIILIKEKHLTENPHNIIDACHWQVLTILWKVKLNRYFRQNAFWLYLYFNLNHQCRIQHPYGELHSISKKVSSGNIRYGCGAGFNHQYSEGCNQEQASYPVVPFLRSPWSWQNYLCKNICQDYQLQQPQREWRGMWWMRIMHLIQHP